MKKKAFYEAFLDRYKPAIIFETYNKHFYKVEQADFPRVQYLDEEDLVVFFQTEEQMNRYVESMEGVKKGSFSDHYILGITLGFPKKSVEFFAHMRELEAQTGIYPTEEESLYSVGITWAGFSFVSHLQYVLEEAQWMWKTYDHPKAIKEPFYLWTWETSYIEVAYGDIQGLKEARAYIMKQRGLVPAANG